jgi:hypothetical protein
MPRGRKATGWRRRLLALPLDDESVRTRALIGGIWRTARNVRMPCGPPCTFAIREALSADRLRASDRSRREGGRLRCSVSDGKER